jgi:Ni/Co efflux regulator RcnB
MKRVAVIGALIASLALGSTAMADGRGHDRHWDGHRDSPRAHHDSRHDGRRDFRADVRHGYGPHAHVVYRGPARYGIYHRPHGYYAHRWTRGDRLPVAYYARPYVIADYRDCGLRAPPRGYHWVRVDGDAVLAAVATGIVLDTVFHVFN